MQFRRVIFFTKNFQSVAQFFLFYPTVELEFKVREFFAAAIRKMYIARALSSSSSVEIPAGHFVANGGPFYTNRFYFCIFHSSKIRSLCFMKRSSEAIQILPYFWNKKTHVGFFPNSHFVELVEQNRQVGR